MSVAVLTFMMSHQLFSINQRPLSLVQNLRVNPDGQRLNNHSVCIFLLRCSCEPFCCLG